MNPKQPNIILLVEDELNLAFSLQLNLQAEGFEVIHAQTGTQALELYQSRNRFVAIILDVMLPEMDGFTIAQEIRKKDAKTGILMLTARAGDEDKLKGFANGADDYITKPFHLEELLLRVKRMAERSRYIDHTPKQTIQVIDLGDFHLDCQACILTHNKKKISITTLETDLLKEFLLNPNKVLSRDYLLNKVWGVAAAVETRTVDNFISRIRKLIEVNPRVPRYLESIRGRGYRFTATSSEDSS